MKKIVGILITSTLLLGACNTDSNDAEQDTYEDTTNDEQEEVLTEETGADDDVSEDVEEESSELDDETLAELDQDIEEINWDEVHLTRAQFDSLLYELQDDLTVDTEEDEDTEIYIESVDFSDDTIRITVVNEDASEFSDFTTGFFAVFIDSFYRQLYLNSDYSDGTTHPHIIIQENDGEVITDQEDFIEFEE